jgi:RNA polymerase sigma factor (sigma-70 family)
MKGEQLQAWDRYRAGDPTALADLVRELEPMVWWAARKYAVPLPTCEFEDYLQEIRIGIVLAIQSWTPEPGASLMTHLYNALPGRCANFRRNQRLRGYRSVDEEPPQIVPIDAPLESEDSNGNCSLSDTIADPDADTEAQVQVRVLAQHLWKIAEEVLNPKVFRTFRLYVLIGLSQEKVARAIGRSQMQVSRQLAVARRQILEEARARGLIDD